MNKFIYGVLVVTFVMFANASFISAENLKFGYVDMAKLFEEYSETKIAKEKFNKDKFAKQEELQNKKGEIEKLGRDLEGQRLILTKEKASEKEQQIRQKTETLQKLFDDSLQKLAKNEKEMVDKIMDKIAEKVKSIAVAEKYDYVFEKNSLLFGGDDLTQKVLGILDQKKK
ncbi:MAG: OmpH family outer membrane protein [Candidatus Firestonebacteria bacterium]